LSNGFKFDQDGNIKVLEMTYWYLVRWHTTSFST